MNNSLDEHPIALTPSLQIRPATVEDAAQICQIYNPYILNTTITFEEHPLTPSDMGDRLHQVKAAGLPWLVLEDVDQNVLKGYCYAFPWKTRSAYRYTVETSIYLQENDRGQGLGATLYTHLLHHLEAQGIHSAIGILALPNPASIRLHEKLGFVYAGCLKDAGFKFDRWIDVVYWQRLLSPQTAQE
ncbi:MAG: GNAT family N-acetyltransferase [Prochlorotrichaceae cyanobacterium]|jgi:phosphinothricin acetyltransferase